MKKDEWAARMHAVLDAGQKPSYELLQEGVDVLLEEHSHLSTALLDMSKKLGAIVMARRSLNTTKALALLDQLIKTHVVVRESASANTH